MIALLLVTLGTGPTVRLDSVGRESVEARVGEDVVIEACAAPSRDRCVPPSPIGLWWYELVALAGDYDNTRGLAEIRYQWRELTRDRVVLHAAAVAGLRAPGTHRLAASYEPPSVVPSDVTRLFTLVVRRDDSYLGYLTELFGVPFVLWPRYLGARHQTDLRLGADCVALVIYGRRRMGEARRYVAPARLREELELVGHVEQLADGAPELWVRAGDVLHFGFQTAVLSHDEPPLGRLGPNDLVIHTYHGLAEEVPLGSVGYAAQPFDVLRWPAAERQEQAQQDR